MKIKLFFLTVVFSIGANASFDGSFPSVYKDKAGLNWSKSIGEFSNGCITNPNDEDANDCKYEKYGNNEIRVKKETSEAEVACSKIGGRLPTVYELNDLITNFEYELRDGMGGKFRKLTDKGVTDFLSTFMPFEDFTLEFKIWSSTIRSDGQPYYNTAAATVLYFGKDVSTSRKSGYLSAQWWRVMAHHVLCVQ